MPNSRLTTIGMNAFQDCARLISIALPSTLKIIEGYSFSGCLNLTYVEISSSVEVIKEGAFANSNANRVLFSPDSKLKKIEKGASDGCGLEAIAIPSSVEMLDEAALEPRFQLRFS